VAEDGCTDKDIDVQWATVHDLIEIFKAVGVKATKAVVLWRHEVRSASRLAALTSREAEQAGIDINDRVLLENFIQTSHRSTASSTTPLIQSSPRPREALASAPNSPFALRQEGRQP